MSNEPANRKLALPKLTDVASAAAGAVVGARKLAGTTAERLALADASSAESADTMPGDALIAQPDFSTTRAVSIGAEPSEVWPWLAQMGLGRAGWYSWDILDNFGRRSATTLHPEWMVKQPGDQVPAGPMAFNAAVVDRLNALVLHADNATVGPWTVDFTLAYDLRLVSSGTRLVVRARGAITGPAGHLFAKRLLGPGDGVMVTKQLREIARRAEGRV